MTTATTVLRDDPPQRAPRAAGAALLLLLVLAPMQSAIWHGAAVPGWVRMMAANVAPTLVAGQGAANAATVRSAWGFALAVPGALVSTAALQYMPHGPLLPLTLAVWLHTRRRA